MANRVVEIHVPLVKSPGISDGEYEYPWIDKIEEFIDALDEEGAAEYFDDGEEHGDHYVFFITGGVSEQALLEAADRVARLDGVPEGVTAYVSTDEAEEWGRGRRVQLPLKR